MNAQIISLKNEIINCHKCHLRDTTFKPCWDNGNINSKLMFVGDASMLEDSETGIPFSNKYGKYLERLLLAIGINRNDIFISNVIMCRAIKEVTNSDRTPTENEINVCSDYLVRQIELIKPTLIVALGKISFKFLTDSNDTIFNAKGNLYNYKNDENIKVYPVLHPSYLLSYAMPKIITENWADYLILKEFINEYCP